MERSERTRLEGIRNRLKQDIAAIDELLKIAQAPRPRSDAEVKKRAFAICKDIQRRGGTVSEQDLRRIVSGHGMPFAAVGALYAGGYLENTKKGVRLGNRGRLVMYQSARHLLTEDPRQSARRRQSKKAR